MTEQAIISKQHEFIGQLQRENAELKQQLKTAQADAVRYAADNLEAIGIDGVYVVKHEDLLKLASYLEGK